MKRSSLLFLGAAILPPTVVGQGQEFASAGLSPDGDRVVMLVSSGDGAGTGSEAFVFERVSGTLIQVHVDSAGNPPGDFDVIGAPSISSDGQVVAFASFADLDLNNPDGNGTADVYVRLLNIPDTRLLSVSSSGVQSNAGGQLPVVSDDGRRVAFQTVADNLDMADSDGGSQDIFVRDLDTAQTEIVSLDENGDPLAQPATRPRISGDGRFVAFEVFLGGGMANALRVSDRQSATSVVASVDELGQPLTTGQTSIGDLSADGRWLTFQTSAVGVSGDSNGQPDVYLRDLETNTTVRVSLADGGAEANGESQASRISDNGALIAFESSASNLVPGDSNGVADVFVHHRLTQTTERVSVTSGGAQIDQKSSLLGLSADGRWVLMRSTSLNLADGAEECSASLACNIFLHDRDSGTTQRVPTPGAVANPIGAPPSLAAGDRLAAAVALNGSDLALGLPGAASPAAGGALAVYRLFAGRAELNQTLGVPAELSVTGFGAALAISGDLMAVGSRPAAMPGQGAAQPIAVAVYERTGGSWQFIQALLPTQPGSQFGYAVALEGSQLVIGAPADSEGEAVTSGAVYLFGRGAPGEHFVQRDKVKPAASQDQARFGAALALRNGLLAVGSPGDEPAATGVRSGSISVFTVEGGELQPVATSAPAAAAADSRVGFAVAVSQLGQVFAGAPGESGSSGSEEGSVYVFSSAANLLARLLPDDPVPGGLFGAAVSVSDTTLAVGSPGAQVSNTPVGAVYRYLLSGGAVLPVRRRSARDGQSGFGQAVSASGRRIGIGAPATGNNAGGASLVVDPRDIFIDGLED